MGTIIVGGVVLACVILAVRRILRNKKEGKSVQCGCDCNHCGGKCHK